MSEELEALKLIVTRLHPSPDNVTKAMHEVKIVEKALKALEIIKNKITLVRFTNKDNDTYYINREEEIIKQEYDLLKEIFDE